MLSQSQLLQISCITSLLIRCAFRKLTEQFLRLAVGDTASNKNRLPNLQTNLQNLSNLHSITRNIQRNYHNNEFIICQLKIAALTIIIVPRQFHISLNLCISYHKFCKTTSVMLQSVILRTILALFRNVSVSFAAISSNFL